MSVKTMDTEELSPNDQEVVVDFHIVADAPEPSRESESLEILSATTLYLKVKLLLSRGVPIVGAFFISYLSTMIIMMFASHYGFEEGNSEVLAGVTLSNLFSNVSLFSLLVGLSSAVETLASQHYGAKNYEEVGIVLQRSICILAVVSIPLLGLWAFAPRFFGYCGIEPAVVAVVSSLLTIRAFTFPAEVLNISYEKYLCAIGVTTPTLLSTIALNAILLVLLPTFVLFWKLPYYSIGIAQLLAVYCSLGVHVWTSLSHEAVQRTLSRPNRRALDEWGKYIGLGIPGAAMICSEWWAFEILAFFASRLGTASVAAQSLTLQILCLAYMVPLGLSIATASLVGNALGAKQRQWATEVARLSYGVIFAVDFIIAVCIHFGGKPFIHFLSNDPQVVDIFESMILFLSLAPFVDGNQSMSSGIMRGTGKQFIGAIVNFCAFYFLGIPCAWYFCFSLNWGVGGLLKGLYVGATTQMIVLAVVVLVFDDYIFTSESLEKCKELATDEKKGEDSIHFPDLVTEIDVESGVELVTCEALSVSVHGDSSCLLP